MSRVKIGNVYPSDEYLLERCAPAGYGLGGPAAQTSNLDTALKCGWYAFGADCIGRPLDYGVALVLSRYNTDFVQIAFDTVLDAWKQNGTIARRVRTNGVWREWEFLNPPMALGTEYQTTERWQGKPVYTKLVDCGNIQTKVFAHGCAAIAVIRCCGTTSMGTTIPYRWNDNYLSVSADRTNIHICTNTDFSSQTCLVQIWYTKD